MPSADSWGGPAASEPPFAEALRELGHDVVTEDYVYGDKDRPTPLLQRVKRVLSTAFRIRRVVANGNFDIIHLNTAFDVRTVLRDSVSLLLMKTGNSKILMKLHGSMAEEIAGSNVLLRQMVGYIARKVNAFGYHTREEIEAFLRIGFDKNKFFPVRNAVTVHQTLPRDFRRVQKGVDEIFELLFVSRFIPAKGLVETIEACEELRNRGIRFRLTCLGDGPSIQDAKDTVGRLALGRVVTFTGYIPEDEVSAAFMSGDIFIFPTSHPEGFPNVLFKAVALGLPIVTTKIRAAADYLSEPENCLFCAKEPTSIADRVQELIENKTLREAMSAANLAYGKTLTPDVIAKEFVEIYETMLNK
jgi:glycosyltransferase involved in cell wall biosynthesis